MFVHIHTKKIWSRFSESLEQKAFPLLLFLKLGHYNKYIISNNCTQRKCHRACETEQIASHTSLKRKKKKTICQLNMPTVH